MTLSEEAKKAKREYQKQWREKNKDKVKSQQERYWEKKALEMQQLDKKIYAVL